MGWVLRDGWMLGNFGGLDAVWDSQAGLGHMGGERGGRLEWCEWCTCMDGW